jgi:polyhydroxybutyrate depolymerase
MMALYAAETLGKMFRGMAVVSANLSSKILAYYKTPPGLSVMIMQGTSDPVVPYEGGSVESGFTRGVMFPSADTLALRFVHANGCTGEPTETELDDKNKEDGAKATVLEWNGCGQDAKVTLVRVNGGGHTLPGAEQYMAKRYVGGVCNDFNGSKMIWEFFRKNLKP